MSEAIILKLFSESQCPDLGSPLNARSECQDQSEGVRCVITCQEGYGIPLQVTDTTALDVNSTDFTCNHADAMWFNQEGLTFPECSGKNVANTFNMRYFYLLVLQ